MEREMEKYPMIGELEVRIWYKARQSSKPPVNLVMDALTYEPEEVDEALRLLTREHALSEILHKLTEALKTTDPPLLRDGSSIDVKTDEKEGK